MEKKDLNRRNFVKGMFAVAGAGLLGLPAVARAEEASSQGASPTQAQQPQIKVPKLPWGYVELDPDEAMSRGYLGYMVDECAGGSFWAITSLLKEKIGYPYTLLPIPTPEEMLEAHSKHHHLPVIMKYGAGGIEGIATVCGALNGASCAIEWAVGPKLAKKIIRMLFRWYEETAFPTDLANERAVSGKFVVAGEVIKPKWPHKLPSVKCESPLCHVVVSHWCTVTGYASGSKARSERCARITAAVARQAVLLMNAALKGKLDEYYIPFTHETATCRTCHYKGKEKDFPHGAFDRGMMACETCHVKDINAHVKAAPINKAFGANLGTWMEAAAIGTAVGIGAHLVATNIGRKGGDDEENKG